MSERRLRELVFVEPRRLDWRDGGEPRLEGEREALVRPLAVSTCDLDAAIVHGRVPLQGPFPLGHECVARGLGSRPPRPCATARRQDRRGALPGALGAYPITVDSSADRAGLACAVRSTEPDGICTSTGIYFEPETPLPLLEAYTKGLTFHTGRVHARPAMPEVLELIAAGRLRPELVTTELVAWDNAAEALAEHTA